MVVLYVGGKKVGDWSEAKEQVAQFAAAQQGFEFCDESGKVLGRYTPMEPLCPWDPSLTREELDRMSAEGGGISLKEFWKRMGVE